MALQSQDMYDLKSVQYVSLYEFQLELFVV
jgi:hypothetical protein